MRIAPPNYCINIQIHFTTGNTFAYAVLQHQMNGGRYWPE
ncbi:hypothetical protein D083_1504 [Dickeya solani RNS 08.23.3.1.A]|nr:hypothetical protein D083_1504 [Dickeya solani RNS 08.23.3.1.A]